MGVSLTVSPIEIQIVTSRKNTKCLKFIKVEVIVNNYKAKAVNFGSESVNQSHTCTPFFIIVLTIMVFST
jgi:hypothetical protein